MAKVTVSWIILNVCAKLTEIFDQENKFDEMKQTIYFSGGLASPSRTAVGIGGIV